MTDMIINKTKPIAYMMVGVPGSGKSTWMTQNLPANIAVVSYIERVAAAMGKTYGAIFHDTIGADTKWMAEHIDALTKSCIDLAWDQTNLSMKSRRPKLNLLKDAGYDVVAVTFEIPTIELARRRKERELATGKSIPESVLESMGRTYVRPTRLEGFRKVIIVTPDRENDGE